MVASASTAADARERVTEATTDLADKSSCRTGNQTASFMISLTLLNRAVAVASVTFERSWTLSHRLSRRSCTRSRNCFSTHTGRRPCKRQSPPQQKPVCARRWPEYARPIFGPDDLFWQCKTGPQKRLKQLRQPTWPMDFGIIPRHRKCHCSPNQLFRFMVMSAPSNYSAQC